MNTRERERERERREIGVCEKEKERRTKSDEVEKMIFNISNRLRLITRTVRAGTCSSARARVHVHARSLDGFPFVRETGNKVKKKSEINGMKQWERPGLRVAAGCVMELGPIKLAKRILGMYRRSKLRFRYYRISFSCLRIQAVLQSRL